MHHRKSSITKTNKHSIESQFIRPIYTGALWIAVGLFCVFGAYCYVMQRGEYVALQKATTSKRNIVDEIQPIAQVIELEKLKALKNHRPNVKEMDEMNMQSYVNQKIQLNGPQLSKMLTCDKIVLPIEVQHKTPSLLFNNIPRTDEVEENMYSFFQVCLMDRPKDKHIKIRVLVHSLLNGGDPDLYVSLSNPFPDVKSSDFIAATIGNEELVLSTKHDQVPDDVNHLYISVLGFKRSSFEIEVQVSDDSDKTHLIRG